MALVDLSQTEWTICVVWKCALFEFFPGWFARRLHRAHRLVCKKVAQGSPVGS